MEQTSSSLFLSLFLLVAFLVPATLFLINQQQTLSLIRPEHRRMSPGQVWLQLIPLFGLVWQFVVISKLSKSIHNQLTEPIGDALIGEEELIPDRPTYQQGISYAVLFCVSVIPIPWIKPIAAAVGLGAWIVYWIELSRYKKKIKIHLLTAS